MKHTYLTLPIILLFVTQSGVSNAATIAEASAVATWQATAKKDTNSKLVVTPLYSLSFQYAEGLNGFSTVNGLFDVAILGESGATDFTLKAKKLSGTLNHLGGGSTLDVGVLWQGLPVETSSYTTLIDTSANVTGGNLSPLTQSFSQTQRSTAQGNFGFYIEKATVDATPEPDFSLLPDGLWSGEVNVEFVATWSS